MSSIVDNIPTKENSKLVFLSDVQDYRWTVWFTIFSTILQFAECNFVCVFFQQVTWLIVIEVRSKSFGLITERRHDIGVLCAVTHIFAYWTSPVSVTHVIFFIGECDIARFLCAMRVFEVRASSSPHMLYFSAKFRFCRAVHCSASPRRKMA